ncbi:MAG: glycosyltransferase family 2 protein [Acidimicrobiales bacterium]
MPSPTPSVSVIIPAYNAERSVAAALGSAFGQTVAPREVIVVDDGSTDATATVVASQFPQAKLVTQDNGGPSAARNRGMEMASAEWVAFLDADDIWVPTKLEHQLRCVERHAGSVIVASDWARGASSSAVPPEPGRAGEPAETIFSYRDMLVLNRFQTSTVLANRAVLEGEGGFRGELDGAEDWDMWLRASKHGSIVKLDAPYVTYTDVASGYSKNTWRVYAKMLNMLARERSEARVPEAELGPILAWHHLRFAVAFVLARDTGRAAAALSGLRADGLSRYVPAATRRYLLPFLAARARRRLGRRGPVR